jgi:uncharacterized protein YndB with AHSA1/START domain
VDVPLPSAWAAVADHVDMANWAPGMAATMERLGNDDPNGVGAIRDITLPPGRHIREEITDFEPERRLGYRALSGAAFPDWTGEVELAEHQGGTVIRWSLSCRSSIPGTSLFLRISALVMVSALAKATKRKA